jgi:LuxR family maltose regulon positive regulatory protein
MPAGSRVALASRSEPMLKVGRLRANRALTEIGPRDLAMGTSQAAALFEMAGLHLAPVDVAALVRETEGWPAGLYLASVALRGQSDLPAAVARFGGDDAIVSEYLRDEVLSELDPDTVSFLRRSSILERLSGPVCDAVLRRRGSGQLLSSLASTRLLLVPLDRRQESYRCHSLLGEMLQADLRRLEPEEERRLHSRASDWYARRAVFDRAVHHAVAAGDTDRAADLLGTRAPAYVTQRRDAAMKGWLGSFTAEQIAARPALLLAAANSHLLNGELDEVQRLESAGRRTLRETPPPERPAALEAGVAILRATMAADGTDRMGEDAARAYDLEPEDSPWRAICCLLEGVSLHMNGDREAAERRLEQGVRRGAVAAPNVQTLCLAQLALIAVDRDDWEGAAALAARATAQVEHYALGQYPTSALVFAVSAVVQGRRGRVAEAQEDVRVAKRLLGQLTDFLPWYEAETCVALAVAELRLSDVAGARELLAEASRAARRTDGPVVLRRWIESAESRVESASSAAGGEAMLLTTAELRVLTFLPTHFSFREIAGRLYVSANTVKTQAHAVYRKLNAASRSEAVARAGELGLLDL